MKKMGKVCGVVSVALLAFICVLGLIHFADDTVTFPIEMFFCLGVSFWVPALIWFLLWVRGDLG